MKKSKPRGGLLSWLFESEPERPENKLPEPQLQPALQQVGITDCPVCRHEVAVFLTRNRRPFLNCSFCSVRIFYNGRESMRLLRKQMRSPEEE